MKKIALSLLMITLCVFVAFSIEYSIDNYDVQVLIGRDAVHFINEDIAMNYHTPAHGFFRDIPVSFSGSPVHARISDIACSAKYSAEYADGYYSMKIGDENKKLSGAVNYNINYNYDLGCDINEGYDEFYFDLLGSAWECRTDKFNFEVYLPKNGLDAGSVKYWVTYGYNGSSKMAETHVSENDGYYIISGTVLNLKPGQAVTVRVQLPDGWYVGARQPWDLTDVFKALAPYLSIVLVIIAFITWLVYGKDRTPIITARFEPPEGFSPMVVGYLADGTVDDKDIVSMVFNWADRGLLQIIEKKKDQFTYKKTAEIESTVPKAERDLFNAFFKHIEVGETLTLKQLQENNFAEAMARAKIAIARMFTKDKALKSKKSKGLAFVTALLSFIPLLLFAAAFKLSEYSFDIFIPVAMISFIVGALNLVIQWALFRKWYMRKSNVAPCIFSAVPTVFAIVLCYGVSADIVLSSICSVCGFILSILAIITEQRSEYGQKLMEEVLGYREFIDKASMDELRLMIKDDPELYYRVLSYAVVMGLEEKWSKKFEGLAVNPPSWYVGSRAVDIMYYSHLSRSMRTVIQMNSAAQVAGKTVGGSGFNASGFAGGGFGGGGGRAW